MVFQCRRTLAKFLQWHSSVGQFQLFFPVPFQSTLQIFAWSPSGIPVYTESTSGIQMAFQCTLAGKGSYTYMRQRIASAMLQVMACHLVKTNQAITSTKVTYCRLVSQIFIKIWLIFVHKRCTRISSQWRHNGCDGVPNHQPHHCLLNRLFRRRSKKTSKLRVTGLCAGNSPVTDEFPAQMASNAKNVSIWWRHHVDC